jgi:O-antigen/teichoic acid export membrane protein
MSDTVKKGPFSRVTKKAMARFHSTKPRSEFAKNVVTLMTGTSVAQILPFLITPILSRLYTEPQFALYSLFTRILSPLGVVVTGRYELAIMLPEEEEDAVNIFALSILCSTVLALFLLAVVAVFSHPLANLIGTPEIRIWLYLLPFALIANSMYQSFNYWFNRKQAYARLSKNRVVRSGLTSVSKVALGFQKLSPGGLIVGDVLGQALATSFFIRSSLREDRALLGQVKWVSILRVAKRYAKFPLVAVPSDLINALTQVLPTLFLLDAFGKVVLGDFAFSQLVLGAPLVIIAGAFADVFKQRASVEWQETGQCRSLWISTAKKLLFISLPMFAVLYFAAPIVVPIIFGERWAESARFVQILVPYYFLAFLASPLSRTLIVAEKQHLDLVWQVTLFIVSFLTLQAGVQTKSPEWTIGYYGAGYAALYLVYLALSYRASFGGKPRVEDAS